MEAARCSAHLPVKRRQNLLCIGGATLWEKDGCVKGEGGEV